MSLFKNLFQRFTGRPVDWDELEEILIRSDLGVPMTLQIMKTLQASDQKLTAERVVQVAREEVLKILPRDTINLRPFPNRPKVILMIGVNGTGKTTSTAKLAGRLTRSRHSAMLVAGDTFRAAAIEQLEIWGGRLNIEVVKGQYGGDAAALCYDAWNAAQKRNIEFLICDTAGRLHTKHNLMTELAKMKRVLAKLDEDAPHEVLMVVDATTGANALVQTREFAKALPITGLVVTKLDGSGKGGILVAIQQELGIPTRFIGTGETVEDFAPFNAEQFVQEML